MLSKIPHDPPPFFASQPPVINNEWSLILLSHDYGRSKRCIRFHPRRVPNERNRPDVIVKGREYAQRFMNLTMPFCGTVYLSINQSINQGFIIKSSRSKANCEVIYNICLKLSILKCTLYYMHYVTTIVSRIYELIQKDKCTFIFTKFIKIMRSKTKAFFLQCVFDRIICKFCKYKSTFVFLY